MMTDNDILKIAMEQSAMDAGCDWKDFLKSENVAVTSKVHPQARKYLTLPFVCNLISYGNNVVASVDDKYRPAVLSYLNKFQAAHCFETPNLHVLDDCFEKDGYRVCFMAEYFLPKLDLLRENPCQYPLKLLESRDFCDLYLPKWQNALCEKRKQLDVLGVGAYDGDVLVGLAGASADCDGMWQIGVDVLPPYRRRGIAAALTSKLAIEILKRGKVPFYCAAWSNLPSVGNALACGFRPAWVELTVKEKTFVDAMNAE